jgi:hypothetical protein
MADWRRASGLNTLVVRKGASTKVKMPDGTEIELSVDCSDDDVETVSGEDEIDFGAESSGHTRMILPADLARMAEFIATENVELEPGSADRVIIRVPADDGLDLSDPAIRMVLACTVPVHIVVTQNG